MTRERNAFTSLCALASREQWCWNIFCWTCGHMHFRYGFYELSEGRHPEETGWRTKGQPNRFTESLGDLQTITEAIQHSERLHHILSEASLEKIAALCRFPDYLCYLGLGLYYTHQLEQQHRLLTPLWGEQLLDMVENGSPTATLLGRRLSGGMPLMWHDLDGIAHAIRPAYRVRGFD